MKRLTPALGIALAFIGSNLLGQHGPDTDPDVSPGYVDNVFHHNEVDSVNLYNGQLTVPIPLGPQYSIGPNLKFQLTLTYNSRVFEYGKPPAQQQDVLYTPIVGDPALGLGWNMTLGAIKGCGSTLESAGPCYYGPDGSEHHFNLPTGNDQYSRTTDGTQFYLHFINSTSGYEMWDGDGNHYILDWHVTGFNDAFGYTRDFGQGRDGWYLSSLSDPFGNAMTVHYPSATSGPIWRYTAACTGSPYATQMSQGPLSTKIWTPDWINLPGGDAADHSVVFTRNTDNMVSTIIFKDLPTGTNGNPVDATYTLTYDEPEDFNQPCTFNTISTIFLREMTGLALPDGSSYTFEHTKVTDDGEHNQGLMKKITLPTGGTIAYDWNVWSFYHGRLALVAANCTIKPAPAGQPVIVSGTDPFPSIVATGGAGLLPFDCSATDAKPKFTDKLFGLSSRTVTPGGVTTYTHYAFPYGEKAAAPQPQGHTAEAVTVVLMPPTVDGTTHARAVRFWAAPIFADSARPVLPGDHVGADVEELYFDHDPRPAHPENLVQPWCGGATEAGFCSDQAARVISRTFEYDTSLEQRTNRRVLSQTTCYGPAGVTDGTVAGSCTSGKDHKVVFSQSATCGAGGTTPCAWDLDNGRHFNVETHSGHLSNDSKTITTKWTPSAVAYLPNLYRTRTTAMSPYTKSEGFDFDPATGFLRGRYIADPSPLNVWLTCRYPDADGNAVHDFTATFFGSGPPVATDFCNQGWPNWPYVLNLGAFGNSDAFGRERSFLNGQLVTAKWYDNIGGVQSLMPWFARNYTRDPVTGWLTGSTDTAGLLTAYHYDELGRVDLITPPGETATTISYDNPNQTTVTRGSALWEQYLYDGLGRLIREIRQTGTATYGVRKHFFDPAGNESAVSEWGSCTTAAGDCLSADPPNTTRSLFDPFGRPGRVVGPSNASYVAIDRTDGLAPYSDTLEDVTTCVNGTWNGSDCTSGSKKPHTKRYKDAWGRVWKVNEPFEPTPRDTNYTYDVNDRVRSVSQGQTRTFTYNMFGYLTQENSPEKGIVNFGDANTAGYGSLGNLRHKTEGSPVKTHDYIYDGAGRLVTETLNGSQQYLLNCYDGASTPTCEDGTVNFGGGAYPKGKLTRRVGTNPFYTAVYPPTVAVPEKIRDDFAYDGVGGRLSARTATIISGKTTSGVELMGGGVSQALESWGYNTLGQLTLHGHPRVRGTLTETLSYSYGRLAGIAVTGAKNYDSSSAPDISITPTFDAGGALIKYVSKQLPSGTAFTTTIDLDTSGLPRPLEIKSSAGGFDTGLLSYDSAGNVVSMGASDTFSYDALSRLTQATYSGSSQTFAYDHYGNLVTKNGGDYCTDIVSTEKVCTNNRLKFGNYDTRGNLVAYGSEALSYDDANRQVSDGTPSSVLWQYLYSGADERIVRVPTAAAGLSVTRREMARYLVQGKPFPLYTGTCTENVPFSDVHCNDPDFGYVYAISMQPGQAQITAGCTLTTYCPENSVSRAEMAVFLLKAEHGPSYAPPACVGLFADVQCTPTKAFAVDWIEQLYNEQITAGCLTNPLRYCPNNPIPEDQMTIFMSKAPLWPAYKPIPSGTTYTLRGQGNQISTEFADSFPARDNVFIGNLLVATYNSKQPSVTPAWQFHSSDHLGTVRLTVNGSDLSTFDSLKYWPYGDRYNSGQIPLQRVSFAAMERDPENNHLYDHARHHDFNVARFVTPDVANGSPEEPQSWNRYTYGGDNPLKYVDPDGRAISAAAVAPQATLDRNAEIRSSVSAFLERAGLGLFRPSADDVLAFVLPQNMQEVQDGMVANLAGLASPISGVAEEMALQFSQDTVSRVFRNGEFAGRELAAVAEALKAGTIKAAQLPVDVVERDGVKYALNNRSLNVLRAAGVKPLEVNRTGVPKFEKILTERLKELARKRKLPIIRRILDIR